MAPWMSIYPVTEAVMSAQCCTLISAMVLFAMAQRGRAVRVHPEARVRENLPSRSIAVKRLQLGPVFGLRITNERQHRVRKDRAFPIEAISGDRDVTIHQKMRLNGGFEGGFGMSVFSRKVICLSVQIACADGVS